MAKQSKVSKDDKEKCKIITPPFRVSYPHLDKAQAFKGNDPKFAVTMLFEKVEGGKMSDHLKGIVGTAPPNDDGETAKRTMSRAIFNAKVVRWGADKSEWPDEIQMKSVQDGDRPKHADKEGYAGHIAIKASTNEANRPDVLGKNSKPCDPKEIYPGCYAEAIVYVSAYDNDFGQGISFILDGVRKVDDGKTFGGRKPSSQVFAPIEADDEDESEETSDEDDEEGSF